MKGSVGTNTRFAGSKSFYTPPAIYNRRKTTLIQAKQCLKLSEHLSEESKSFCEFVLANPGSAFAPKYYKGIYAIWMGLAEKGLLRGLFNPK